LAPPTESAKLSCCAALEPRDRETATAAVRQETVTVMHYPRRISLIKRKRKSGFRARMRTHNGRKLINRKRRVGRRVNVV
jgi:large subunit ribosomal protein L34